MTSDRRWAAEFLQDAGYDLHDATTELRLRRYARAVTRAASSVELSVKAALFSVGIEPPEEHKLWRFVQARRSAFPKDYRAWAEVWAEANETTARLVVRARYGDRTRDRLPSDIFDGPREAEETVSTARQVFEQVSEMLRATERSALR